MVDSVDFSFFGLDYALTDLLAIANRQVIPTYVILAI